MQRTSERRVARRISRRSKVRYWVGRDDSRGRHGFTNDISSTGAFIVTPYPYRRGTEIRMEVVHGKNPLTFEAVVTRRVWVAPDLRRLGPSGMGVRFRTPEELVARLGEQGEEAKYGVVEEEGVYRIALDEDRVLLEVSASEIELGGFFIPTETPPPLNTEITLEFQPPDGTEPIRAAAVVVQRIPAGQTPGDQPAGIAVAVAEPEQVLDRLRPYLDSTR